LLAEFAKIAYGVGKSGCRGVSVLKAPGPLVRTPISSQRLAPLNTFPKSRVTVNRPLVTPVVLLVSGPARALPPLLTLSSENVRS